MHRWFLMLVGSYADALLRLPEKQVIEVRTRCLGACQALWWVDRAYGVRALSLVEAVPYLDGDGLRFLAAAK